MIWPFKYASEMQSRNDNGNNTHGESTSHVLTKDESHRVLLAMATTLPDPFLALDDDSQVILANDAACQALDADPTGKHISATIRAPLLQNSIDSVLQGGAAMQVDYHRHGLVKREFEVYVGGIEWTTPQTRPAGSPAAIIILRDLTYYQMLDRMRADFVANASHELRTPLTSIIGFIETLLGPARNDAKAQNKFLKMMLTQSERMRRLIDDLLSLSRIEMNAHQHPETTIDLGKMVEQAVKLLRHDAEKESIQLSLDLPLQLYALGDYEELVQVVHNLLENAIKYGAEGKKIEISGGVEHLASDRSYGTISIRDFGPGIAEKDIPRLTERFYRVSVQESRSRGGTGLGLAIVKHILNRHRGKLLVESEPGLGSTFIIHLPLAAESSEEDD